jgi:hypothetical protein
MTVDTDARRLRALSSNGFGARADPVLRNSLAIEDPA